MGKCGLFFLIGYTSVHPAVMGTWCKLGFVAHHIGKVYCGNRDFILALCPMVTSKSTTVSKANETGDERLKQHAAITCGPHFTFVFTYMFLFYEKKDEIQDGCQVPP